MEQIFSVRIPKVYNLYRTHVSKGNLSYTSSSQIRHESYKCHCCGAEFRIDHKWRGGLSGTYGDDHITCPGCGKISQNEYKSHEICYVYPDRAAPNSMVLTLSEGSNAIVLNVRAEVYKFDEYGSCRTQKVREYVKFDVRKRKTTYKTYLNQGLVSEEELNITPSGVRFLDESIMYHIRYDGEVKNYLKPVRKLVQKLRLCIRKKYKKIHGINIGPLNVKNMYGKGRVTTQLYYMAYRMLVPDITALPENGWTELKVFSDLDRLRRYPDSITAFIDTYNIPNIKSFRRIIKEHPYDARLLGAITKYIKNPDIARRFYEAIKAKHGYFYNGLLDENVDGWLGHWTKTREPMEILRFFESSGFWLISDTYRMESQLSDENREAYKHIKLSEEGHQWLNTAIYEQMHKDYDLAIPEEIRRRFEMQVGTLRLFMPNTHFQMRDAGEYLHNCVGTYAGRVLSQECMIVFVSDDVGKLVAAIEVRDGRVVQAKLKFNKPVCQDPVVNQQIIDWARSVKVEIGTADVAIATKNISRDKTA